jgi:hypothetical protein
MKVRGLPGRKCDAVTNWLRTGNRLDPPALLHQNDIGSRINKATFEKRLSFTYEFIFSQKSQGNSCSLRIIFLLYAPSRKMSIPVDVNTLSVYK